MGERRKCIGVVGKQGYAGHWHKLLLDNACKERDVSRRGLLAFKMLIYHAMSCFSF